LSKTPLVVCTNRHVVLSGPDRVGRRVDQRIEGLIQSCNM